MLFRLSEQKSFVVHLQPGSDPAHHASNYIIRELARINNKRADRTGYSFTFDVEVQLTRRGNRLVTRVNMDNFRFRGDYRYMGFDMADVLLPFVDFKLELRQGRTHVTTFEQRAKALEKAGNRFSFEFVDSLSNDNRFTMVFSDMNLNITHINRRGFDSKTALIRDYFATEVLLHDLFLQLQSIDVYELDYLALNQQRLMEVQQGIAQINSRDFYNLLELWNYDPIALGRKMNDIIAYHHEVSLEKVWVMENLHVLFYERGVEQMPYNTRAAKNSFQESLRVMPEFAPALLALAKLHYHSENDFSNAMQLVTRAWRLHYIDPQTRQNLQEFSVQLANDLHEIAHGYEQEGSFQSVIETWIQLRDFCNAVPVLNCGNQAEEGISRGHRGMYRNMYEQAAYMLARGELNQGETHIRQAINYQRTHNRYISSSGDAQALLLDIKESQYRQFIQDGRTQLQRQSYRMALEAFENALVIEREFSVSQDNRLPGLIRQSKRPLLIAELDRLSGALQRNELQQARSIMQSINDDIRTYDFVADQEIVSLMEEYQTQLQDRHCANIQMEMNSHMRRADQYILEGRFLLANEQFEEIDRLSRENNDCMLDLQAMERRRMEVLPAINYQQQLLGVEQQIRSGQFSQAVNSYNEAGRYFEHHGVAKFRLEHLGLDLYSKSFQPVFIMHVANMFAHMGEAQTALQLVYHLQSLGIAPRQLRSAQESTGRALAREDAAENPNWKPRQKVREYTHRDRSLRFLRRAYVQQFRRSR